MKSTVHHSSRKQFQCCIATNLLFSAHMRNQNLALKNLLSQKCNEIYYITLKDFALKLKLFSTVFLSVPYMV